MPELFRVERPAGINRLREETQEDPKIWQDAYNIKFQHGLTKKVDGYEEGLGTSLVDPSIIVPLRDDDGLYYWWAYVGENPDYPGTGPSHNFYRITNTIAHEDVTPDVFYEPTTGREYQWTGDTINGVPFLTYGVPYYYENSTNKFKMFENIPRAAINTAGDTTPAPGSPGYDPNGGDPRVRFMAMRAYKNFLVGMNFDTDDYVGYFNSDDVIDPDQYWGPWEEDIHQNAVWWSHSIIGKQVDETWQDANSIKSSGWNFLGGSGGNIIDGKTLRDSFIIYRERSVWQMSYIGGVQIFAFKEIFNDIGCLGLDCIIEIDGEHLVVGQSDVYRHNGVRKTTVADGVIRKDLFERIHPDYNSKVFIAADYKNKEAWICIPTADQDVILEEAGLVIDDYKGSCNLAYVYNWVENTWSKKEIPWLTGSIFTILSISETDVSWDAVSEGGPVDGGNNGTVVPGGTWESSTDTWHSSYFQYNPAEWGVAMTSKSQKIFTKIDQQLRIGEDFTAIVEKTHMDMGERLITKHISRVYPLVRHGAVDVYVDSSMTLEEGTTWGTAYIGRFDPTQDEHIACRVTGRYIHIRFVIPEESRAELRGYWVEYDFIGRR